MTAPSIRCAAERMSSMVGGCIIRAQWLALPPGSNNAMRPGMLKAVLALAAALLASPALADTLIHNANGLQVGADGKLQRFEALLISDDGKVVQTFTKVQNPHAPNAARIDAQGRTLLPGLIDAHGHVTGL